MSRAEYVKQWRLRNPDRAKEHAHTNKIKRRKGRPDKKYESVNERIRVWKNNNKDKVKAYSIKYYANKKFKSVILPRYAERYLEQVCKLWRIKTLRAVGRKLG